MNCPKCGFDMDDNKVCKECGFEVEKEDSKYVEDSIDDTETDVEETEVDYDSLENLNVDFNEVDGVDSEDEEAQEDEMNSSNEDLVIDFDEIDNKVASKSKKSNSWIVAFVSFVAGVLATLITIGCVNGTVMNYFDKVTNGTPTECIESFCKFYYLDELDAGKLTKSMSPYIRAQFFENLKNSGLDIDTNADITNDKEFENVMQAYIDYIKESMSTMPYEYKINSFEYGDVEYYKSGTDEFEDLLSQYQESSDKTTAKAEGVTLFAKVSLKIKYTISPIEQETTTTTAAETTTAKTKKSDKDASTTTTTQTTTSTTESTTQGATTTTENATVNCVKINNTWYVFDGIQTDSNSSYN